MSARRAAIERAGSRMKLKRRTFSEKVAFFAKILLKWCKRFGYDVACSAICVFSTKRVRLMRKTKEKCVLLAIFAIFREIY